jgi:excisionase family DNA binding protein
VKKHKREELRKTLSVEEAAAVLGIGRNMAYRGVHDGWLPAIRCGRRFIVPRDALEALLARPHAVFGSEPMSDADQSAAAPKGTA